MKNSPENVDPPNHVPEMPMRGSVIEEVVFRLRWALLPFIVGLCVPMCMLGIWFVRDLVNLFFLPATTDGTAAILALLDKFMVATLLITTMLGTYQIYLRPLRTQLGWVPAWLDHFTAKDLKIVTCLSLAGVSSIKLLEDFHQGLSWGRLSEHLAIHFGFILSALIVAIIARLMRHDN